MEIRAADGVETFVRARGGRLYIWTSERCWCWGSLTLLKADIAWSPGAERHVRLVDGGRLRDEATQARLSSSLSETAHGRPAYWAVIAPSATSTVPVTNEDSSEARNRATLAISRGSPGRPMGWNESIVAYTCSSPPSSSAWA